MKSSDRIGNIDGSICRFAREDVVLDAGTGGGFLLDKLSSKCKRVYAIDVNSDSLYRIRQRVGQDNILLLQADVRGIPFASLSFTRVICTEVLEHLRDPIVAIGELHRILKVGKIAVIAVPTRSSEILYSRLNPNYSQNEQEHVTILEKDQWISLFRKAGFDVLATRNENFQPALYWVFRNLFPIEYDPSSGLVLENRRSDIAFSYVTRAIDNVTFGGFSRLGNRIFPKSWYFYLRKVG